jgi:hypothetical protein
MTPPAVVALPAFGEFLTGGARPTAAFEALAALDPFRALLARAGSALGLPERLSTVTAHITFSETASFFDSIVTLRRTL